MGVAATVAPKGFGPQDPTKKLASWVELLSQPLSWKLLKNSGLNPLKVVLESYLNSNYSYIEIQSASVELYLSLDPTEIVLNSITLQLKSYGSPHNC